jgi:cleavage and polyadenylation specificity factor subunit 1
VRWLKISQPTLPKYVETSSDEEFISRNNSPLRIVDNVGGYSTVVGTWPSPCFVLKEASTMPKVVRLSGGSLNSIDAFHTANCDRGFISVDSDVSINKYNTMRGFQLISCRAFFEHASYH